MLSPAEHFTARHQQSAIHQDCKATITITTTTTTYTTAIRRSTTTRLRRRRICHESA